MKVFCFLLILILAFSCDEEEVSSNLFRYDPQTGKCRNGTGSEGLNALDVGYIRSTRDAECFDLSGYELILLHDKKELTSWSLSYDTLNKFNFRGARLDSATLFFNFIYNADFRGTDLRTLQYGYAGIRGITDQYTKLPNEGMCESTRNFLECYQ